MASKMRHSKYRNIFCSPYKTEKCMMNINFSTGGASDSTICDVNGKFIAVIVETTGGGSYLVLKIDEFGRIDNKHPKVNAHTGKVTDIKCCPFRTNIIASCSEDCTVKTFSIPDEGLSEDIGEKAFVGRCEAPKKMTSIMWHPTAEDIIGGICHDMNLYIWRIDKGELLNKFQHPNIIFSFAWNFQGSLIATTGKDKFIRCWDYKEGNIIWETAGHQGTKASRICFSGSFNTIITTGFSKDQQREISVWVNDKPTTMSLDTSSAVLYPLYDEDTHVLTVLGKGDTTIRFYEIFPDEPYIQFLTLNQSSDPMKGFGFQPKSDVDFMSCEIGRIYKLQGKSNMQPNSVVVPRKSSNFQDDVFLTYPAKEAALSADEWVSGKLSFPRMMKYCSPGSTPEPSFIFNGLFYDFKRHKSASVKVSSKADSKVVSGSWKGEIDMESYEKLKIDYEAKCEEVKELNLKNDAQKNIIEELQAEIDKLKNID